MRTLIDILLFTLWVLPIDVQVSLVQRNYSVRPFLCTSLLKKPDIRPISRDLYTNTLSGVQNDVQARFVQGEETERKAGESLSILFWNVENFYDWRNDSTTVSDAEFSAGGERHWTWKRFQAKANAFAKALLWVESETGRLPDVVGLAEVENAFVLRQVQMERQRGNRRGASV